MLIIFLVAIALEPIRLFVADGFCSIQPPPIVLNAPCYVEVNQGDCNNIAFEVVCSSDEIRLGRSIECRIKSDAQKDARISVKWRVSGGLNYKRHDERTIKVWLTNSSRARVKVTAKIVSPRVCFDTASMELRVVKRSKHKQAQLANRQIRRVLGNRGKGLL